MTVYNVNLGIGWASSGVEYAQAYRAQSLRKLKIPAKFIFSDLIFANNIEDLTKNLGYSDDEIIWFYNFFTDVKIAPSDYPLSKFEDDINLKDRSFNCKEINGGVRITSILLMKKGYRSMFASMIPKRRRLIRFPTLLMGQW
nr:MULTISPECIES: hypothetical protein [Limosilactobacillus]